MMNCPECGHKTDEHGEYGCFHPTGNPKDVECNCSVKKAKLLYIELAAWKAEAELARVIIDELLAVDDAFLGLAHNQLKDYLALRGENQTK